MGVHVAGENAVSVGNEADKRWKVVWVWEESLG